MYSHMTFTWFFANLLHPVIFCLISFGDYSSIFSELLIGFFVLIFWSLMLSLPSLLTSYLAGYLLQNINTGAKAKFVLWLLLAPLITLLNVFLICSDFFRDDFNFFDLEIGGPSMLAVVLTILLRNRDFFKTFNQQKNKQHETNMV